MTTHDARLHWFVLEVAGPTFEYKDQLKQLGLKFDPRSKTWRLDAVLYKSGFGKASRDYDKNHRLQEAAFPVLQQLVKTHNERVEAEIKQMRGGPSVKDDAKGFVEMIRRHERMSEKLKAAGILIEWKFPNQYELGESRVWVSGNTFDVRDLMKKHGWRWDAGQKRWWMVGDDYRVVGDEWMGEIVRRLPKAPEPPPAPKESPFARMTDRELTTFLTPAVDEDYERNEGWDGEQSWGEAMAGLKLRVRRMTPAEQVEFYEKVSRIPRRRG